MPGSAVKLHSRGWSCSSAGDGPGRAGVYWDGCSLKDPKAGISGTEEFSLLLGGEEKSKSGYLPKIGSRSQVQSTLSSSSLSEAGRCSGFFLEATKALTLALAAEEEAHPFLWQGREICVA